MQDAFQAFIEFLVDLFNALSKFLGFDINIGDIIDTTAAPEDDGE